MASTQQAETTTPVYVPDIPSNWNFRLSGSHFVEWQLDGRKYLYCPRCHAERWAADGDAAGNVECISTRDQVNTRR